MINVSTTYDNLIEQGGKYDWQVVNGTNTFGADKLIGGTLTNTLFEQISIGNVIASQLDLQLRNVDVDTDSPLVLQFRANLNDGEQVSSWYTKGTYYIDNIEASPYSEITKITAFDALIKANEIHQRTGEWLPITTYNLTVSIASFCGISIEAGTRTLLQSDSITLTASPNIGDNGTTKAELLSIIAALYGGSFIVNTSNQLELVPLDDNPSDIAEVNDAVRDFDASPVETIKRVRVWVDDTTAYLMPSPYLETQDDLPILTQAGLNIYISQVSLADWEAIGGRVLDVNLPFYGNIDMAQRIYDLVKDKAFIPYTTNFAFIDPKYEVGDGIDVKDIVSVICNQELSITPLAPCKVNLKKDEPAKTSFERNTQYNLAKHGNQIEINTKAIAEVPAEIERATTLITGGYGGYVKWTYLPDGTPSELLFMDAPEEENATYILRINRNGIGFSDDGGTTYRNAWTIDGRLNADFITTGLIKDLENKNYWNLDTGEFCTKQGIIANGTISNDGIFFVNTNGQRRVAIGDGQISFDILRQVGQTDSWITEAYMGILFESGFGKLLIGNNTGSNLIFDTSYATYKGDEFYFDLQTGATLKSVYNGLSIQGNLTVNGQNYKSKLADTEDYSKRLLYCLETPTPMFSDYGEGTIAEDGTAYIWLDPIFAQTISTDGYQVLLTKYGEGECYVVERNSAYFIVKGTSDLQFSWVLNAKQLGFEQRRLDIQNEFTPHTENYGSLAVQHITELYEGRVA